MKFIIYTPEYDENIGGIIVLHKLCHLLNELGEEAYLWIHGEPPLDWKKNFFKSLFRVIKYDFFLRKKYIKKFRINESWNTPISKLFFFKNDFIVIYPEIYPGNPLNAKKIIRWLLYKPGELGRSKNFTNGELIFYYDEAFNDKNINKFNYKLKIIDFKRDIYFPKNDSKKKGFCYLMRKGENREIIKKFDLSKGICIDGLSHEEISKIFNTTKYLISFDLYTMYTTYAAMCNCIPIIIPDETISEMEWRRHEGTKYGKAYGCKLSQIKYAKKTRKNLINVVNKLEKNNINEVKNFLKIVKNYFKR